MQALNPPITANLIPRSINLDHDEIKKLKAVKLLSLELYVRWALILTYGYNKVTLSDDKMATCFSIQPSCCKRLVRRKQVGAEMRNLSANAMLLILASACKMANN